MTYLLANSPVLTAAAAEVDEIGVAIGHADQVAVGATAGIRVAAADEVSAAIASFFNVYADGYAQISRQAAAVHGAFARALAAAGDSYARAETMAASALTTVAQPVNTTAATQALLAATPVPVDAALILSASGIPTPSAAYVQDVYTKYVQPHFPSASEPQGVSTPNGLYPFTGVKDLTLDISVARGSAILTDAILRQLAVLPPGGSIAVLGYSQSAVVSSLVMPQLLAEGITSSQVNFVLIGNPMNPNGGVAARFAGLLLPSLGFTFDGATPHNDFPTYSYTLEYDGFADFPRYPLNLLADLNAVMGIPFVHGDYQGLTQAQLDSAVQLRTAGPTQSTYYMIPTENLPLLEPVRSIPYIGNPLAELLQPDLRVLVNLGYGDPAFGYDTGPANLPTPFGLFPPVNPVRVLDLLASGSQQGIVNAAHALQAQGTVTLPPVSLPSIADMLRSASQTAPVSLTTASPAHLAESALLAVQATNDTISTGFVRSFSTAYGVLLPTADIATEVAFTLPSYNLDLFINGLLQAVNGQPVEGLINAIGYPIAADTGLLTLAGGFEAIVIAFALDTILFGTPHPYPYYPYP